MKGKKYDFQPYAIYKYMIKRNSVRFTFASSINGVAQKRSVFLTQTTKKERTNYLK